MKHPTLQQTIANIRRFHDGQMDKSGVPYYHHLLRVMVRLGPDATDVERHAALLHDTIEDTKITLKDLEEMGYSAQVLDIVVLMTRYPSDKHRDYIYNIIGSKNVSAMRVKLADLYDNANIERANRCPDEAIRKGILDMIESRYKPAIRMVKQVLGNHAEGLIDEDFELDLVETAEQE